MSINVSVPYGSGYRSLADAYEKSRKKSNIFKMRLSGSSRTPSAPSDYVPLVEESDSDSTDIENTDTVDSFLS